MPDDSWSDGSELTELTDSDEDEAVKVERAKTPPKPTKPALRPPRTVQYPTESLLQQMRDGSIDLDPEYQRGIVWTQPKQQALIDSLRHNFYIPPLVFAVKMQEDGEELRICIDGKQRLTSIRRFMENALSYKDSISGERHSFERAIGGKSKPLHKTDVSKFKKTQITCVEYDDITDDQEREIFSRVQNGSPLTTAERLQAVTGPWATLVRHIQKNVLNGYAEWNTDRGRDFQCVASVLLLAEKPASYGMWPGHAALETFLSQDQDVRTAYKERVLSAFRALLLMSKDSRWNGCFKKPTRPSPIEFIGIALLLLSQQGELGFTQTAHAIEKLRADVRKKFPQNLRQNSTVLKHLRKWIDKMETQGLRKDGCGDVPIVKALEKEERAAGVRGVRSEGVKEEESDREVEKGKGKEAQAEDGKRTKKKINVNVAANAESGSSRTKRQRITSEDDHEKTSMDADEDEQPISLSRTRTRAAAPVPVSPVQKKKAAPAPGVTSVRRRPAASASAAASGSGTGTAGATPRSGSSAGVAGTDTGFFDKGLAERTNAKAKAKPTAANPVVVTKRVVQKTGAGGSYSSPNTPTVATSTPKTKPARPPLNTNVATNSNAGASASGSKTPLSAMPRMQKRTPCASPVNSTVPLPGDDTSTTTGSASGFGSSSGFGSGFGITPASNLTTPTIPPTVPTPQRPPPSTSTSTSSTTSASGSGSGSGLAFGTARAGTRFAPPLPVPPIPPTFGSATPFGSTPATPMSDMNALWALGRGVVPGPGTMNGSNSNQPSPFLRQGEGQRQGQGQGQRHGSPFNPNQSQGQGLSQRSPSALSPVFARPMSPMATNSALGVLGMPANGPGMTRGPSPPVQEGRDPRRKASGSGLGN